MKPPKAKQLARQERADLAAFLATLSSQQWEVESLCEGWSVKDVVSHMISYEELTWRGLAGRFVKGRFVFDRINALGVADYRAKDPRELMRLLGEHLEPRGLPAAFGGMIALLDGLIHHQDIRRPLGRPRQIPGPRLKRALELAMVAPPIGAVRRARGLRLCATDIDFVHGRGPDVEGPAEAILMAIAGRSGITSELTGEGVDVLDSRISA